ncbi:rhamnulose-1-phosphate aldolase [Consotaella salsifontis]|uniref:Rhamnulose-1-phosphate aldolase n=1 Tax=Consotaella salsifontis TaxID=1365950 RepID=A0A1T4P0Y9_9HYPH|nr:rhamnulose-1-phosphate aldolase [Consotaella salsifontis]SJZ85052.1 L-rhamnulose 1-phosphate aldolase [Consotaella salsifontis]
MTMALHTEESWFVAGMVKATSDMWLKGWDERNGGNVSMRLMPEDVEPYLSSWSGTRLSPLGEPVPELAGQYFIVTGTGKYFRNVQLDPEANLGVVRVRPDGAAVEILWGYSDGGGPTSELASHFKSHRTRQKVSGGTDRVIMHCHATNLLALTYVLDLDPVNVTRALWEASTECLVVFPQGVGTMPWLVPGTDVIGDATAGEMASHTLVLWPFHGVFGTGASLDEAFGLIDTAEKASEVLVKVLSMGGPRQTISTQNLIDLGKRFAVQPMPEAIALEKWKLAGE